MRGQERPHEGPAVDRPASAPTAREAPTGCAWRASRRRSVLPALRRRVRRPPDARPRQARDARLRRPEHGDEPPALTAVRSLRGDETLEPERAQAALVHRQPPGRLAPGRPLQRLRRGRPAALGALPGGRCGRARRARATTSSPARSSTRSACRSSSTRSDPAVKFAARGARPTRRCATSSATASTATSSAAGASPRRTSSSAGLLEIRYESLDELCAADEEWAGTHPALATAHARAAAATSARRCSTTCAASSRSTSTTCAPTGRTQLQAALEPAARRCPGRSTRTSCSSTPRSPTRAAARGARRLRRQRLPVARWAASASSCARPGVLADTGQAPHARRHASRSSASCCEVLRGRGPRRASSTSRSEPDDVPGYQLAVGGHALARGRRHRGLPRPDPRPAARPRRALGTNPFFVELLPRRRRRRRRDLTPSEHTAQVPLRGARGARGGVPRGAAAGPVLLADDGARRRHRRAERRQHAQRPADAGELRPALRPRRPQRPAGPRLHLLLDRQPARPVLLPPARADGRRARSRPPRLDLANEDLVRAHVHAIWLAETAASRSARSLTDVLDVDGDDPTLDAATRSEARSTRSTPRRAGARDVARRGARWRRPTSSTTPTGAPTAGSTTSLARRPLAFDDACDRWRELYRAALEMRATQNKVIGDASRSADDRERGQAAARARPRASSSSSAARRPTARSSPTSTATATSPAKASCPATASRACRSRPSSRAAAAPAGATSSCRGRGSSRSASSGRGASSTTRARAT